MGGRSAGPLRGAGQRSADRLYRRGRQLSLVVLLGGERRSVLTHQGLCAGRRAADGPWDVSVWGRNLFDKDYLVTSTVNATWGITQVGVGEPRTYGVTLRTRF